MSKFARLIRLSFVGTLLFGASCAFAQQDWPTKAIDLVVPQPAGGVNDLPARIIAEKLQKRYGVPVLVLNRPGAGGNIGSQAVAKAKPDGYTLLLNGSSLIFNVALDSSNFKFPGDLTVIAKVADFPSVITVNGSNPSKTLRDFVSWTQEKDVRADYGSAGVGSGGHIFGAAFTHLTGAKMTHIPYIGGPTAVNGLVRGDIAMFIAPVQLVKPFIDQGKLRGLAVTSEKRLPALPSIPTVAEAGYPKLVANQMFGVYGPAGLPEAIVHKLNKDINEILMDPSLQENFLQVGLIVTTEDPNTFRKELEDSLAYWRKMVADSGVKKE